MAESPQGPNDPPPQEPGWWIAGKWYPANGAPAPAPPVAPASTPWAAPPSPLPPPSARPRNGIAIGIAAAVAVLVLGGLGIFLAVHHDKAKRFVSTAPAGSTTVPGTPPGYAEFVDHADEFRIAVPAAWRHVDVASPGASQVFAGIEKSNPKLGPTLNATLRSKAIKFFAIQVNGTGFSPNVNVGTLTAVGVRDTDLAEVLTSVRTEYKQLGFEILSTAYVPLAGHRALHLTLRALIAGPGGSHVTVSETQYLVAANDLIYTITLSGTSPAFPMIVNTFKVS